MRKAQTNGQVKKRPDKLLKYCLSVACL